jgi:hypothetical protein
VDNMTRWQRALEHNPDDLTRNQLWGVCVFVAMSFQIRGKTYQEFSDWYQWEWAATEKLGRRNNHRPGKGGGLNKLRVGEPEESVLAYQLDRAWQRAERNIATTELPSTTDLRFIVESNTSRTGSTLLCVFDDLVLEHKRLNQASFTYPCRPAAKRLGISHMAVSRHLKKMIELGYIRLVRQGTAYEGRVNPASIYSFVQPQQTPIPRVPIGNTSKRKKKPIDPCSVANLKKLDAAFGEPLTYQDVLANGGTVAHWKRWLGHLQTNLDKLRKDDEFCEKQETKEARCRLRIAEMDKDGAKAVEDYRREQDRKTRRWFKSDVKWYSTAPVVESPLRRMMDVLGSSTAPEGAAVTFQYTEIFVCEEVWGHVSYGRDREAIILTPQDDVSAAILASVGQLDPTDLSHVDEVMDALSALKVTVKPTGG